MHTASPRPLRSPRSLAFGALAFGALVAGALLLLPPPFLLAATPVEEPAVLAPTPELERTAGRVVVSVEKAHYRDLEVDDALSGRLFEAFLEHVDPARLFLLESDVEEFERYRTTLDEALEQGDLDPAFEIFRRAHERRLERLEWLVETVGSGLDGLAVESGARLELDREDAPWLVSPEAADELWRRRLKNEVIELRLAERTDEKVHEVLARRYENQLSTLRKTKARDVFDLYMNTFLGLYDPHTSYFSPRTSEAFDIEMSLSLEGIGALLGTEGEYVRVQSLVAGGPAEKGGELQAGDRITGVGQGPEGEVTDIVGWRIDDVVDLIRGPKGSYVRLHVLPADRPEGAPQTVVIQRDEVRLEEQSARKEIVELERDGDVKRIGVIHLPAFYMDFRAFHAGESDYKSSTRDVRELLLELREEGVDGVVVDLRNNGGGSLMEAAELTGLFVGRRPIVQVKDAQGQVQVLQSKGETVYTGPLVVLVNRLSASASEIFAAAIQDYARGIVVGSRTFGKGTVQTVAPLQGDGRIKLTQAKFYRVSGGSTQHKGVVPDIELPSRYAVHHIGESALDDALPWDEIDPLLRVRSGGLAKALPELQKLHEQRMGEDPHLRYVEERNEYRRELRERESVSLEEQTRRREREEMDARLLAIENHRREALGLEPAPSLDEAQEGLEEDEGVDALQREAARVMADLLALGRVARF